MARRSPQSCRAQLTRVDRLLEQAITGANKRGYTGMVHSRGSLFDDPRVRALIRKRDVLLKKC